MIFRIGDMAPKREPAIMCELKVGLSVPYHEAIIDDLRLQKALREALNVHDLIVYSVNFEASPPR
jgi:hypothetical protein